MRGVKTVFLVIGFLAGSVVANSAPHPSQSPVEPSARVTPVVSGLDASAMPPLAGLSCSAMRSVLAGLDAAGYRGLVPMAQGHENYSVFLYEDALARQLYFQCTLRESLSAHPNEAFPRDVDAN
jgi:hypothetical protein